MAAKNQGSSCIEKEAMAEGGRLLKWMIGIAASLVAALLLAIVSPIGGRISSAPLPRSPNLSVFEIAFLPG